MEWTTGLVAVIGAAGGAVGAWLALQHKHKIESAADKRVSDSATIEQYKEIADRLEKHNARWEEADAKKQKQLDHLVERDLLCQVRLAKYWGCMQQLESWARQANERLNWLAEMAKKEGYNVGEMVPPPKLPSPPPEYDDSPGFAARTSAQETELLKSTTPTTPPGAKP